MIPPTPLLELTLFVADIHCTRAFFEALGFSTYTCEDTVDVAMGGTVMQLFAANATHPATRLQLGLRVPDLTAVQEGLTRLGHPWEPLGGQRLQTRDPDGNRVHVVQHPGT